MKYQFDFVLTKLKIDFKNPINRRGFYNEINAGSVFSAQLCFLCNFNTFVL